MRKKVLSLLFLMILLTNVMFYSVALANNNPNLVGTSAIAVDLDTNEVIYTKNSDEKRQPASITKLMTALLLAENKNPEDLLVYPAEALKQAPYSYGLNVHPVVPGDTFTAKNAMDILLLYSGNDIAYTIANNVGGSEAKFIELMNLKAKELGMSNTNFVTSNGLDDNTNEHYTTAYDLSILIKAAYNNPWIKETMSKKTSQVNSSNGPIATIENRNKVIGIDGNIAGKTGYTTKAGRCFASIYSRNGRNIAVIVLNSNYDYPKDIQVFEDAKNLADYSFSANKEIIHNTNDVMHSMNVNYNIIPFIGPEKTLKLPLVIHENISTYNTGITADFTYSVKDINPWKLNKNKEVGTMTIKIKGYTETLPLYPNISTMDLIKENIIYYIILLISIILVVCLIIMITLKFKRKRRKRLFR